MKLLFITDPLENFAIYKDTTFAMMREADRQGNISDPSGTFPTGVAPGLYRVGLGAGATAPFARVRTLQADVSLPNQLGVLW